MTVLPIVTYPNPILKKVCQPVTKFDRELAVLLDNMHETMLAADGVGLAAPQVGVDLQVAIVDFDEGQEIIEMINPEVIATAGEEIDIEGCLSFPGLYGEVARPFHVKIEAQERSGQIYELEAEGYEARAILHEIDHLQGKLFDEKIIRIVTEEEIQEMMEEEE